MDLTLVEIHDDGSNKEIDMGTAFDYFGPESQPAFPGLSGSQRAHRMLLQVLMMKHGFTPFSMEWWHFKLLKEPFPETYFDFPVE